MSKWHLIQDQPRKKYIACEQALLFGRAKRAARERASERRSLPSFQIKEQNRWEKSSLEQNYEATYHTSQTTSHVSVRLAHVSDSLIPKGPWELF